MIPSGAMKCRTLALLVAAAQLACVRSSASQAEDPAALLNEAASAYRDATSLQLEGTKIREQHDDFVDSVTRTPFLLILTPDNKFRQESKTEAGVTVQVCDGEMHWNYSPQTNKYSSAAGTPNPSFLFNTAVDLRFLTTGLLSAKFLRQESLQAGGAQHFCDVIEAHYERTHQSRNVEFGDVAFWIDHASHLVWKTRMPVITTLGQAGARTNSIETTLYTSLRLNQDLRASTFAFTPPLGATEQKSGTADARESLLGHPAPDFKLRDLDGEDMQLSALKGKVVLLDFWATWCGPCRMAMPKLDSLYKQFRRKDVMVVGIDENEDEQTVRNFIHKNHYEYPILLPLRTDPVIENYSAHALPTLVVIDKNGLVADYKVGYASETEDMLRNDLARVSGADYVSPAPAPAFAAASASIGNWPEPKTADDFLHRGYEHLRLRDYARAVQDATSALDLKPGWAGALRLRARAAYEAKDYDSAVRDYSAVLQQHPDWSQMYDLRGLAYSYSGRHNLAIPDYTQAIRLDPYVSAPYNNRGWAYLETGDVPHAIQDLNQTLELAPDYVRAHENRAKALDKQNDLRGELADLEDIIRLAPDNQWARQQQAHVQQRLGSGGMAPSNQPSGASTESQPQAQEGPAGDDVRTYDVGGNVIPPVPVYNPNPPYTDSARNAKYSGVVMLLLTVDAQGNVVGAQVIKAAGYGLDESALNTVRTWKFKPATKDGVPVRARVSVEVSFKLFGKPSAAAS
jgi:TonB family protein